MDWNDAVYDTYDRFFASGLTSKEAEVAVGVEATRQIFGRKAAEEILEKNTAGLSPEEILRVRNATL